jgi:hypothetical protein
LQLVAAEETIEEFAPTLASVKANLDRIEASALEAYRAAEKSKKEAAAKAFHASPLAAAAAVRGEPYFESPSLDSRGGK